MDAFDLDELIAKQDVPGQHTYEDFFASGKLSLGLAIWPVGVADDQQPHPEDEVYHVVAGRGQIRVAQEDRHIEAGSVVFVAAGVEHRFHSVEEDLHVLVFWAPPRGERPPAPSHPA